MLRLAIQGPHDVGAIPLSRIDNLSVTSSC
jgi:hypothetical protein